MGSPSEPTNTNTYNYSNALTAQKYRKISLEVSGPQFAQYTTLENPNRI